MFYFFIVNYKYRDNIQNYGRKPQSQKIWNLIDRIRLNSWFYLV